MCLVLVVHDEGLTGRELLGQDGETLFALLGGFDGDEVLDLMCRKEEEGRGRERERERGGGFVRERREKKNKKKEQQQKGARERGEEEKGEEFLFDKNNLKWRGGGCDAAAGAGRGGGSFPRQKRDGVDVRDGERDTSHARDFR